MSNKKATLGNSKVSVTYNPDNPLEYKIAQMRVFGISSKEYDRREKERAKEFEKYKEFEGIDCTYRGTEYIAEDVTPEERLKELGIDLPELQTCFCCGNNMGDPLVVNLAFHIHETFYVPVEEDDKWSKEIEKDKKEFKERVKQLKKNKKYIEFNGTPHEVIRIGLQNECEECGNRARYMRDSKLTVIEPYYKSDFVRASSNNPFGCIAYNKETDHVIGRSPTDEIPEGYVNIPSHHPDHQKVFNKLINFDEIAKEALEKNK